MGRNKSKKLGVGVIGAGFMGVTHAKCWVKINGIDRIIVCDQDINRAKKVARKIKSNEAITDYQLLLKIPEIDIIDICLPTPFHQQVMINSARARKHVLCEKPIALTLKEADTMIEAARRNMIKFMVAHTLRFRPEYTLMKEIIDSKEIGKPLVATVKRLAPPPNWSWKNWILNPKQSAGAVVDLQIHDLDFLSWIFGRPCSVIAWGIKSSRGAWDHTFTALTYKNGGRALVEASFLMPIDFPFTEGFRILCQGGLLEYISEKNTVLLFKSSKKQKYLKIPKEDSYYNEIEYFVECVRKNKNSKRATSQGAKLALEIALAASKSIETGGIINL